MPVLVTGAAGFIGYHVSERLLAAGGRVVGLDTLSDFYDPALKRARLARLASRPGFAFHPLDVADGPALRDLVAAAGIERVVHLAAQPGVRHALTHPESYGQANLVGFLSVLEACRHGAVRHLVYASSSSVYGANRDLPFSEDDRVDRPISLYAATKRANELMAYSYAHAFGLPSTGLRFFTVYGPWGRPDMAVYRFTDRIARGLPIDVAADGAAERDFTFVDDVADGVVRLLGTIPAGADGVAARLFNIGGDRPERLDAVIAAIERELGRTAIRRPVPLPAGDVMATRADTARLARETGTVPAVPLAEGIRRFVAWYRAYHGDSVPPERDGAGVTRGTGRR